jgi:hypothetical protein
MKNLIIILFFFSNNAFPETKQGSDLKAATTDLTKAIGEVKTATNPPQAACSSSFHISSDNCGSRVPASYWNEFILNVNQNKDQALDSQAEKINNYIENLSGLDESSKNEMKSVFVNLKKGEASLKAVDVYGNFLKSNDKAKLNEDLEKLGYNESDRNHFTENFERTSFGTNLKKLSEFGINYNSKSGGWNRFDGSKSGVLTPAKIKKDPALQNSLKDVFGEKTLNELLNTKRTEAVNVGGIVFTPPIDGERMATYNKDEWTKKVQEHLDFYYSEIKDSSEAIPKLGSMWDGWKLHSGRSHLKLVNDQFDRLNNASVQVDALKSMGFPKDDLFNLSSQIARMGQASSETVNDVYKEAESLRKKLYGVAAGAAFAATPYGQALFLESIAGGMGYLAAAGVALPYIQNGVNVGIKVAMDGGSFWCQYSKTLANSVADSAFNGITMAVIPIPQAGDTIKSIEALLKIGKNAYKFYKAGKKGWEISGKIYDCYSSAQAFSNFNDEVDFYSEMKDLGAIDQLKFEADEMHKEMLMNCSDLAFAGINLGLASVDARIKKAKEKVEEKKFQKEMNSKDPAPRVETVRGSSAPTFQQGKSFYKATNGKTYEVKVVPNADGTSRVFFLSGDRKDKVGTMSDSNLSELMKGKRLFNVSVSN